MTITEDCGSLVTAPITLPISVAARIYRARAVVIPITFAKASLVVSARWLRKFFLNRERKLLTLM